MTIDQYANPLVIAPLRNARDEQDDPSDSDNSSENSSHEYSNTEALKVPVSDMIFENAVLFMRDALVMREFTDAIKAGHSERIVLVLKLYALMLRGGGRTKYAHEILHLIHNLTYVWPEGLR